MDNVLSQKEIDQLINGFDDLMEEMPDDAVVRYDFTRPNRFSRDQLRNLEKIYSTFARSASTTFSVVTRRRVEMHVGSIEELVFDEFVRSIPSPTMLNVFSIAPLQGTCVLEMNLDIVYIIFDIICGGSGRPVKRRELTDIEIEIMRGVISTILSEDLKNAWSEIVSINPELVAIESNPQHMRIAGPTDATSVASISIKIGDYQGMLNVCIPYAILEPMLPKLSGVYSLGKTEVSEVDLEVFRRSVVSHARATCEAVLGSSTLCVEDLLELGIGDVIPLNRSPHDPITIEIEGKPRFLGRPGKRGSKLAVQILKRENNGE
jgi:flagellar motor switch protein FliM